MLLKAEIAVFQTFESFAAVFFCTKVCSLRIQIQASTVFTSELQLTHFLNSCCLSLLEVVTFYI